MKPSTLEWIAKAEGDFITALMSYRARKNPNFDAACYHAQQCVEKYLKARLEEANQSIPKTHNLYALLTLILPFELSWNIMTVDLNILSAFAVAYRYPGLTAAKIDAKDALTRCKSLRKLIRTSFGLTI